MDTPMVTMWMGRDVRQLTRAELLDVVQWLAIESRHYREECDRMRRHVNWVAYLMEDRPAVMACQCDGELHQLARDAAGVWRCPKCTRSVSEMFSEDRRP